MIYSNKPLFPDSGRTKNALQVHPDGKHLIYSMGNKVTIRDTASGHQDFLTGHTNVVTTLCVSRCGTYIASGQLTHLGFKVVSVLYCACKMNLIFIVLI